MVSIMTSRGIRVVPIMVVYAAVLHICWAVCIYSNTLSVNATSVSAIYRFIDNINATITTLLLSSFLSIAGLVLNGKGRWLMLVPQQIILMMSATGAVSAMWLGHFADGVGRPVEFIIVDQLYAVLTAIGYTVALIYHAKSERE